MQQYIRARYLHARAPLPLCPSPKSPVAPSPSPVFAPPLQLIPSRKTLTSSYSSNRQTADFLRPPFRSVRVKSLRFFFILLSFSCLSLLFRSSSSIRSPSIRLCLGSRHRQVSRIAAELLAIHRLSLLSLARFFALPSLSVCIVKSAPVFSYSRIPTYHGNASARTHRILSALIHLFFADFALAFWPFLADSHASIDALKDRALPRVFAT